MPAFELSFLNAWIFMSPSLLVMLFWMLVGAKKTKGDPAESWRLSKTKMAFCAFSKLIYFASVAYSVFLPLKLSTTWFYVGFPITLVGLVGSIVVLVNWANNPAGKPVTRGIYRYSRHPMYVTEVLLLFGVSIASASWVFLLFPIVNGVGAVYFIKIEEAYTRGHYDTAYREYMNRTPRWIAIPKTKKEKK